MNVLVAVLRELLGLFDGWLALMILAVVILAGIIATLMDFQLAAGATLLFGCIGVLFANVARAARRR
jgi:hypothetical protein